jgi:hypothetical protein
VLGDGDHVCPERLKIAVLRCPGIMQEKAGEGTQALAETHHNKATISLSLFNVLSRRTPLFAGVIGVAHTGQDPLSHEQGLTVAPIVRPPIE